MTARMADSRQKASLRDACALNAMGVYAQLLAGFALFLYDRVGTPGYLCLPLSLAYVLPLWAMGRAVARRGIPAARESRWIYGALALVRFIDGQILFSCFCAFLRDVMPDTSVWGMALAAALLCAFALDGKRDALPSLGRLLKWLIGALLLYCLFISLPHGKIDHFFPLLGWGPQTIGHGTLWLTGAVCGGVWPLILPAAREQNELVSQSKTGLISWAGAMGLGLITYLLSVWLLPVYAMVRPQTLGWRLMLIAHMTPSIPAWSMEVIALMLLFSLTLCHSVSQTGALLARCAKKEAPGRWVPLALLLLLIPAGAADSVNVRQALLLFAFLRGPAALLLVGLFFLKSLRGREAKA